MTEFKELKKGIISIKLAKKLIISLIVCVSFELLAFPIPTLASAQDDPINPENDRIAEELMASFTLNIENPYIEEEIINNNSNHLPENPSIKVRDAGMHPMTAYNSEAAQTDSDPCTTANGFNVCKHGKEDTIAANFLKFGTKVKIPSLFGDRIFVVRDRMNSRYSNRVDVWMLKRSDALKFGVKIAKIEIVEP